MKKYLLGLTILLLATINVYAKSDIYSINMDVYLQKNGNMDVTEYWDVRADDGTEWFKQIKNLNESKIINYTVSMDGEPLKQKNWNVKESLSEKRGYYGINEIDNGIELCFGKYDYNRHTFIIKYTMTNAIFNTSDSQILIGKLINNMPNHNFQRFKITLSSYYYFPMNLDVWGTGFHGLTYVDNGKIYASNETMENMGEESYVSLLIKFPLNTFDTNKKDNRYETFLNVKKAFDEGTFDYNKKSIWLTIVPIILFITGFIFLARYFAKKNGYGFRNNKKIKEKETNAFRDIPCNKDIFYANALIKLNNFGYKETNIFGAVILKWVKENKVSFERIEKHGLFKEKEEYAINLTKEPNFTNQSEQNIWNIMYEASNDGILENNELKSLAQKDPQRFLDLFKNLVEDEIKKLKSENHIYKRKEKAECSYGNVMDDMIYEDSQRLLGLKIFLKEFSSIDEKETIEVHLWDEYLMFAYLFGIADKVFAQLKKLYPEIIQQDVNTYNSMMMATSFANTTINSALQAAERYSAGGGGFSTGGGGSGGFGGGISGGR